MKPAVLCVDDDPAVRAAYQRFLGQDYAVTTAEGGATALAALAGSGPFAVIVTDLRMPEMGGGQLLAAARERWPDTVRMLLTGEADLGRAIQAVNDGHVFRFLTKPVNVQALSSAVAAAVAQNRLLTAERELLDKTLRGSVQVLAEVIALVSPAEFDLVIRGQRLARELAAEVGVAVGWELDVAAVLSQLGSIVVPDELLRAARRGASLPDEERERVDAVPQVAADLLRHIPRLDSVREVIRHIGRPFADPVDLGERGRGVPVESALLKVAFDFESFKDRGLPDLQAVDHLGARSGWYDPGLLAGLRRLINCASQPVSQLVPVRCLAPGMVVADDLYSGAGVLLLRRGVTITGPLIIRIESLEATSQIPLMIRVLTPGEPGAE